MKKKPVKVKNKPKPFSVSQSAPSASSGQKVLTAEGYRRALLKRLKGK